MKIGFFDSGQGGLLIAKAVQAQMVEYDYFYYGDTANVPYGDKSQSEIFELTKMGVEYLFSKGCILVVVACNTASVQSIRELQEDWLPTEYPDRKILGVVIPTVEELHKEGVQEALLLATSRTVDSNKYETELAKIGTKIILHKQAAPLLVPLLETGDFIQAVDCAYNHISDCVNQNPNLGAVILGCTHYSLIVGDLRKRFPEIRFFAQSEIIPKKLEEYLGKHKEIKSTLTTGGTFQTNLTGEK